MINPLVSIIVPVYNGENYLSEAIDSALTQTYENIEIIVVNDGSTDKTEQICLSFGDKIRYYKKENGGVATAVNLGIEKTRGEYFSWLSHDDLYYPRKIEVQIEALRKSGDMKKICFGDFDVMYQLSGKRTVFDLTKRGDKNKLEYSVYPVVRALIGGCALLVHKSHFDRVGLFDENLRYVQDYDMWFKMFLGQKTVYVNELLYTVRNHSEQGTQTKKHEMKAEEIGLWSSYIKEISDEEMADIYGSKLLFLFDIWNRIKEAGKNDSELSNLVLKSIQLNSGASKLIDRLSGGGLCIFGAGAQGRRMYRLLSFLGLKTSRFVDNNSNLWGTKIYGDIKCLSPAELNDLNYTVIVAIDNYEMQIKNQLNKMSVTDVVTKTDIELYLRG